MSDQPASASPYRELAAVEAPKKSMLDRAISNVERWMQEKLDEKNQMNLDDMGTLAQLHAAKSLRAIEEHLGEIVLMMQ